MSDTAAERAYRNCVRNLLAQFIHAVQQQPPFILDECDEESLHYLEQLESLPGTTGNEYAELGQAVVCRTIAAFPHLVPLLPRDLLWHFGGDCLHYMPDDEIDKFQQLDERLHQAIGEARPFDYERERAAIFGLH
ncbi:PA2817 family protein [Gilvimarinus algae]|uniref:PA2817 family protein n=1 Tax=Gilvimarinus algae TaxID=3058037 RepID=A0ABT8T8W5_9GAMM|nr:PA2817 family protein [Gilvimarinus sp. SDUM040014]MDO3380572.1 PA2817 family protein [Gilvimarinus sp. SDUM040014]